MRGLPTVARTSAGLALAAAVAGAGVSYAAQPPAPHAAPRPRTVPDIVVRAEAVSGMHQTVHAYAAPAETKFVADFPAHLEVRIFGGKDPNAKRRVRFQCVNRGCALFAPDQPEGGDRKGPGDYEIDAKAGTASLHVSIESDQPGGSYTVYAEPVAKTGERSLRSGPFLLISR